MKLEKSCGAVVFTRVNGEIKYLLIRSVTGFCGFPKGHVELGESEAETALREIFEEVGLKVSLLSDFRCEDEYCFGGKENVLKKVVYFLAEYEDQEISCQREEVSDAFLLDYESALFLLTFEGSRRILTEANNFLTKRNF